MNSRPRMEARSSLLEIAGQSAALFTVSFTPFCGLEIEILFTLSSGTVESNNPPTLASGVKRQASSLPVGAK